MPPAGRRSGFVEAADARAGSAPRDRSSFTTSVCPSAAAHMSAVCPRICTALTSAPRSISSFTASTWPVYAVSISTVSASPVSTAFGSSPASSSRPITAALPFTAARYNGRTPVRFRALKSAPAPSSRLVISRSIALHGPVQSGHAVGLRCVEVRRLFEQRADRLEVAFLCRIDDGRIGLRGHGRERQGDAGARLHEGSGKHGRSLPLKENGATRAALGLNTRRSKRHNTEYAPRILPDTL